MSAQERKEASTTAPITPQRPEGGFRRFLRKLFDMPLESQHIQQSTPTIVQSSQGLEKTATNLSAGVADVKDVPLGPVLPESDEPLDLTSEISQIIELEFQQVQQREIAKREKEEAIRLENDAKVQREAEEKSRILAGNERAREIVEVSGIKEILTQAKNSIAQFYPDADIKQAWAKRYISARDHATWKQLRASYDKGKAVQLEEDLKPSDKEEQILFIRLGWNECVKYREEHPDHKREYEGKPAYMLGDYYYVEVICDGFSNILQIKGQTVYIEGSWPHEGTIGFDEKEWHDAKELKKAILTVVKDPLYEGPSHADFSHPWKNLHGSWD